MRNSGVVEQQFALGITPRSQPKFALSVSEENVAAVGPGKFQGDIEQREQDFIQHSGSVELARRLQKEGQLLQIAYFAGYLDFRNLAQEITGGIGSAMLRVKDGEDGIPRTEL